MTEKINVKSQSHYIADGDEVLLVIHITYSQKILFSCTSLN